MSRRILQRLAKDVPVTGYVDYRDYLAEIYQRAKAETSPYSYETFAEDLGFSAINTLRLVINRQRLLAAKSARTIVEALDLRREARRYFLAMVAHINTRSPRAKAEHFRRMLAAKQQSIVSHREKDELSFLAEWYHWVVLEMLRLDGSRPDPAWLAERLLPGGITPEKVKRSLGLLQALGLYSVEPATGHARVTNQSPMLMDNDPAAGALALTRHHQSMLEVARDAVNDVPPEQRDFNALTVNVSYETFRELGERIRQMCAEVLAAEGRDQPRQCVAQVNVNLFTLTKWQKGGES